MPEALLQDSKQNRVVRHQQHGVCLARLNVDDDAVLDQVHPGKRNAHLNMHAADGATAQALLHVVEGFGIGLPARGG